MKNLRIALGVAMTFFAGAGVAFGYLAAFTSDQKFGSAAGVSVLALLVTALTFGIAVTS